MSLEFNPRRLDVAVFAQAGAHLGGNEPLASFERLREEGGGKAAEQGHITWSAQGESRKDASGHVQHWLHLSAEAAVPQVCQRCLEQVDVDLVVQRSFRFVATEAQAEAEDEDSEEDVLALARDFDLLALVEDELLMELPLAPMHEVCPKSVPMSASDPDFDAAAAEKPKPFAALAGLRAQSKGQGKSST